MCIISYMWKYIALLVGSVHYLCIGTLFGFPWLGAQLLSTCEPPAL